MLRCLLLSILLVGCVGAATEAPTAPNQLQHDDKADGGLTLWAGLTSWTFTRYAPDPCNDGANVLGDDPILYDEYVRERATIRNLCFEVWSPGITDWDNPDFWKQLDVEAHYRFGTGPWRTAYVPSNDRRYNNRRYIWPVDYSLDPTANAPSLVAVGAPLTIVSEQNGYAQIHKDLEVYFTVNGRSLKSPSGHAFIIRYEGQAREPSLPANPAGYVLHPSVTCPGLTVGSGAGFFAFDLRDPAAIATLAGGANVVFGIPVAHTSASLVSGTFSMETTDPGEQLPSFRDPGGARIVAHGTTLDVALDVYDRASDSVQTLATTFTNCSLTQ